MVPEPFTSEAAVTDSHTPESISIGLDDGYAYTKLALPDGRLVAKFIGQRDWNSTAALHYFDELLN